ncbi:MAG: hypothetical protein GC154_14365 [bacterium]|nr:hypothetical protein [bacterium]
MKFACVLLGLFTVTLSVHAEIESTAKKLASKDLHNLFHYSDHVFSGAEPSGEAAFHELKEMGVVTIISVDGARPDVEAARKEGIRYIHFPIGYDGMTHHQALMIAKAVRDATGPVYLHCHHGEHRGPTAAAMAMTVLGEWSPEQAVAAMRETGTGAQYTGLYQCVLESKPAEEKTLDALPDTYVASADTPPMVAHMVGVSHAFENLGLSEKAKWGVPADHPDIDPPHEALMLREHLVELGRLDEAKAMKLPFGPMLNAGIVNAQMLEDALRKYKTGRQGPDLIQKSWKSLGQTCNDCHAIFRNPPRQEKQ